MFRETILPIFRSTSLCVTACGIMHPRCCRPVTDNIVGALYQKAVTHSLVLLKMGKIISRNILSSGIINKPLLWHLVGCLYYLYQWCTVKLIPDNEIYLLNKYIKSVVWRVAKRLSYIQDARCLKVNGVHRENFISPEMRVFESASGF